MSETASHARPQILTKRHIIGIVVGIAVVSACGLFFNGSVGQLWTSQPASDEIAADPIKPLPVNVVEVASVDSFEQARTFTGTVRARHRSDLAFEIPGTIESVAVDEGDTVNQDQVLAELDTETLDAQMEATLARLDQARARLEELEFGPRKETIEAAKAAMLASESVYDNAVVNLERRKRLREAGAISIEEFQQAQFAEKTAKANLNAAIEQYAELDSGTRPERIAAQASAVRQLRSAEKEIQVAIAKSKLRAPFAGTVTRRYLDPGSIAPASAPVLKLVEQQHLEAWIGLPVAVVAKLELGSRHEIRIDGQTYHGDVSAKIQELDPATRTQTVLFKLDSITADTVVSGQICKIEIVSTENTPGYRIPTSALVKGIRGLWSVVVLIPDPSGNGFRTQKRDIEIIKTGSNQVLVNGRFESGDQMVVDGVHRIAEGQLVIPADHP